MAERGRRVDIDLVEVEKLAMLHATDEEIAGWFDVTVRTIERRKSEPGFVEAIERGRARGKLNLRRIQLKLAEQNAAMAIFLGKNQLGQVGDSGEAEHSIRRKAERHSGMIPNTIGA